MPTDQINPLASMSDSEQLAFILRILKVLAFENCEDLWWRCDNEYAPLTLFIDCSDAFWWGTADCEAVTPENVHILEEAFRDCKTADPKYGECYASLLFCARVRKVRPQGAAYPGNDSACLWPLFDACGPEREIGMGNPYRPGQYPKANA